DLSPRFEDSHFNFARTHNDPTRRFQHRWRFGRVRYEHKDGTINRQCENGDHWPIATRGKNEPMKRPATLILLMASVAAAQLFGQIAAVPAGSASAPPKKQEKPATKKEEKSSTNKLFGGGNALQSNEPTKTEIYADKAIYTAATGDVELTGTPRVQEGQNMHVATNPDTVMIINQNSQLTTHGPSRTEIRQQPKDETKNETKPSPTSPPSPKP